MTGTTRFDAAEYLDTSERQAAYITVALETGDPLSCETRSASWHGLAAWQRSQKDS